MPDELNTKALFKTHYVVWRILGMLPPKKDRTLYWMYSAVFNISITIGYPLHLIVGLFASNNAYEFFQNMAINLTCAFCTMKTIAIWWRFDKVDIMFEIIQRQDDRVRTQEEMSFLRKMVHPPTKRIILTFTILCSIIAVSSESTVLFNGLMGNWTLMHKGYFPFDIFKSTRNYIIAHLYQIIGLSYMILQNVVNDTFAPAHLCLLRGQVQMLNIRIGKIGHDSNKGSAENNQELLECIKVHKDLLEYHHQLEEIISVYMFFQIMVGAFNMCIILVFIILFVKDIFTLLYYTFYFIGVIFELLPGCYYGTLLEDEFHELTYALFTCNWPEQDVEFRKNLRIIAEHTTRRVYVTAWLFRVNNNAFILACKNAYALFALVMNIK
ncbi:odorant receptor 33a-like [Musca vetustissima]|uniref:odorant receptor 33a-like n=1 Tax=Musca vetustissima TaxID=27455 RepID=UPI002AB750BB|nr:odorant receptor 33a-like [Musca vetustissima]